jgi:HSP20 family molecular chaperone IbpA
MLLDLVSFYDMFPNYSKFKTPMWSEWEEKEDSIMLSVAVPGYEKEDFKLFVENGYLSLEIKSPRRHATYSIIPDTYKVDYDFEKSEAIYKNGVLKITIPKTSTKKNKEILIKVS